jgi:hypothetical protein
LNVADANIIFSHQQPAHFSRLPQRHVEEIQDSEEERNSGPMHFYAGEQYATPGDENSVGDQNMDRGTRIRRPTAKAREGEKLGSDSVRAFGGL